MFDHPPTPAEPAGFTPLTERVPRTRPLALVGILAWLIPGMGHLVMGRVKKAVVMLVAILGLFATGISLTAFTCIDPSEYELEFAAQIFAGGPTLAALLTTDGLTVTEFMPHFDVGRLYVNVAGLLNVVAISDALGLALAHNAQVAALRQVATERRLRELRAAAPDVMPETDEPPPQEDEETGAADVFPPFGYAPDAEEEVE